MCVSGVTGAVLDVAGLPAFDGVRGVAPGAGRVSVWVPAEVGLQVGPRMALWRDAEGGEEGAREGKRGGEEERERQRERDRERRREGEKEIREE